MELNTLFWIACVILYALLVWRFYDGLNTILPHSHWLNAFTAIFWPGFIVGVLALIVLVVIVGCVFAVGFAGLVSYDILKTLFTGKPIGVNKVNEGVPVVDEDEDEYEYGEEGE